MMSRPVALAVAGRGEMVDAYQKAERELIVEVDTNGPLDEHDTPAEH